MLSSELFLKYAKGLKTFEISGQNQAGQGKIVSNPKFYVLENEQVSFVSRSRGALCRHLIKR